MKTKNLGKKGQKEIVIGVAMVVLVLIFILFAVIFNSYGDALQEYIQGSFGTTKIKTNLNNYLKTQITVDGKTAAIAEFIAIYEDSEDNDYKKAIKTSIKQKEGLLLLYTENEAHNLYVEDGKFRIDNTPTLDRLTFFQFCQDIPSLQKEEALKVCLETRLLSLGWWTKFWADTLWQGAIAVTVA